MLPLSLSPNWDVSSEPNTSVLHRVNTDVEDVCFPDAVRGEPFLHTRLQLTLVGTVGVSLIAVIPTVVVPVARPVLRDAAAPVAFKLDAGAGMAAAGFVAVIATVVVCHTRVHVGLERKKTPKFRFRGGEGSLGLPLSQRQLMLMQRPLAQVNWVSGKQVG